MKQFRTSNGRSKPHVLIISEKWCDSNPEFGITNSSHSFWGPLEASGLASYDLFHFDEYFHKHNQSGDAALLALITKTRPDYIFLIWIWSEYEHNNPSLETLYTIREEMGIPIASWWGDTHSSAIMQMAEILAPFIDITYVGDSRQSYRRYTDRQNHYLFLPHGKDPRIFNNPGRERDYDVGFAGSIENRPDRVAGITALRDAGIQVQQSGGQREAKLSVEEYAEIFKRSKIVVNYNGYNDRTSVVNGRIFEATLCGAMLIEPERSGAKELFKAGEEFVTYTDINDLVAKVRHYLASSADRKKIAEAGEARASLEYSGRKFWEQVFADLDAQGRYSSADATVTLSARQIKLRKFELAENKLNKLLAHSAQCSKAWFLLALSQFEQGKLGIAEQMIKKSLLISSTDAEAVQLFIQISIKKGTPLEALPSLQQLISMPDNEGAVSLLLDLLWEAKEYEAGLQQASSLIQFNPREPVYYVQMAMFAVKVGDLAVADELIRQAKAVDPPSPRLSRYLIKYHQDRGEMEAAQVERVRSHAPLQQRGFWDLLPEVIKLEYAGESKQACLMLERHAANTSDSRILAKLENLQGRLTRLSQ